MILPQRNPALLRHVQIGPEMGQPILEPRIFAHLRMKLQRQQVGTAPERLMRIVGRRCQQLDIVGQVERIAVPMQHRHIDQMAQRRRRARAIYADRCEAQFHMPAGIDRRAQRRRDHLTAQAHAQGRSVGGEPRSELIDLERYPGMDVRFIDAHRPAHHDKQIGIAQIHVRKIGAGDIDPVDKIARRLDRLQIACGAFARHMSDDQCSLHDPLC